ncbi:hypothetical protein [uncultured Thiodictyon sp.]|uniref:hypothetical protein n=1 Tax=uncultured Thiodictyon sp. TaxID=1846217 RepID=UPI0025FDA565|nr:hypothetical protein [uncultured Thiodictyon sp.]
MSEQQGDFWQDHKPAVGWQTTMTDNGDQSQRTVTFTFPAPERPATFTLSREEAETLAKQLRATKEEHDQRQADRAPDAFILHYPGYPRGYRRGFLRRAVRAVRDAWGWPRRVIIEINLAGYALIKDNPQALHDALDALTRQAPTVFTQGLTEADAKRLGLVEPYPDSLGDAEIQAQQMLKDQKQRARNQRNANHPNWLFVPAVIFYSVFGSLFLWWLLSLTGLVKF